MSNDIIRQMRSGWVLFFTSSIISILLFAFLGEVWARITFPATCGRRDRLLHHRYEANCHFTSKSQEFDIEYRYNSLGLRTDELKTFKPANVLRILMLGDSFTEGAGVNLNQTFSRLLEARLNQTLPTVEVINAGISGYSPLLEYLYLRDFGLALKPDVVVMNINATDPIENEKFHLMAIKNSDGKIIGLTTPGRHFLPENIRVLLWNRSRIYAHLQQKVIPRLLKLYWGLKAKHSQSASVAVSQAISLSVPSSATINNPFTFSRAELNRQRYLVAISQMIDDINNTKLLAEANGANLVVVFQPHGYHVAPFEWKTGKLFYQLPEETIVEDPLRDDLRAALDTIGVNYLDLTEIFRKSADSQQLLYFPRDGHWTPRGHTVAADNIGLLFRTFFEKIAI